jgi:hypothetical protein
MTDTPALAASTAALSPAPPAPMINTSALYFSTAKLAIVHFSLLYYSIPYFGTYIPFDGQNHYKP